MAILKRDDKEIEIPDGSPIRPAAEQLEVPFGCTEGFCGTCIVQVEGNENLGPLTSREEEMDMDPGQRLCCQATITQGTVIVKLED